MDSFFVKLQNRGLVHLEGNDRHKFLQGLITNDITKLKPGSALYACLLTPQGKFLHDFFISEGDGFTLLECEGGTRAQDLYERLCKYRLRADVQISVEQDVPVYAILSSLSSRPTPALSRGSGEISPDKMRSLAFARDDIVGYPDPRDPEMGFRSFTKPTDMNEKPFAEWDRRRIALGVPDGSRDMAVGQSTLDESNIEKWNGVSYDKGCYVGQELTARMKHRGLGKKHLQTVRLNALPENAELRSSCGDIGLALVKN
ncbi:MAG TPA: folate-binding protein [Rhodospirillaceae bacterium]|nr:folate-binding protein [Rhodospirillaceae bacterium]